MGWEDTVTIWVAIFTGVITCLATLYAALRAAQQWRQDKARRLADAAGVAVRWTEARFGSVTEKKNRPASPQVVRPILKQRLSETILATLPPTTPRRGGTVDDAVLDPLHYRMHLYAVLQESVGLTDDEKRLARRTAVDHLVGLLRAMPRARLSVVDGPWFLSAPPRAHRCPAAAARGPPQRARRDGLRSRRETVSCLAWQPASTAQRRAHPHAGRLLSRHRGRRGRAHHHPHLPPSRGSNNAGLLPVVTMVVDQAVRRGRCTQGIVKVVGVYKPLAGTQVVRRPRAPPPVQRRCGGASSPPPWSWRRFCVWSHGGSADRPAGGGTVHSAGPAGRRCRLSPVACHRYGAASTTIRRTAPRYAPGSPRRCTRRTTAGRG